ncbi:MAG: 5'/3'-nucleotidase SurE [Planctomycetota bacterium]|nr:5'/3'-nucleotidase SurE [Planctomycetota bacterium]
MKRILLTNDDGLSSPGLSTLARELLRTGRYELRVVAPEKEQSCAGHCMTLHFPLYTEEVTLPEAGGMPAVQVYGTPADCVKIAITNLFPDFAPDLVISGINRGPNVGLNVLYSGTVAGALEACMNGIPAVALSLDIPANGMWHFALAAELSVPLVDAVLTNGLPEWTALNINIPNRPQAEIKGVRVTRHGKSGFKEYYVEEAGEGKRRRFRLEGTMVYRDTDTNVDGVALREGWISITPLGLAWDHDAARKVIEGWGLARQKI